MSKTSYYEYLRILTISFNQISSSDNVPIINRNLESQNGMCLELITTSIYIYIYVECIGSAKSSVSFNLIAHL